MRNRIGEERYSEVGLTFTGPFYEFSTESEALLSSLTRHDPETANEMGYELGLIFADVFRNIKTDWDNSRELKYARYN